MNEIMPWILDRLSAEAVWHDILNQGFKKIVVL